MIYQGLFKILHFYFEEIDLFYTSVDNYFNTRLKEQFNINSVIEGKIEEKIEQIIQFFKKELLKLSFSQLELENKFSNPFVKFTKEDKKNTLDIRDFYKIKIAPEVYELYFEKICDYLVDLDVQLIISNLIENDELPTEFLLEIANLKNLYDEEREKERNLRKYIQVKDKILNKFYENKENIESLEDLKETREKIQLLYFIYRIIEFFNVKNLFDFSHIETYLRTHLNECLISLPLASLKNPELYYCAIYLSKKLEININYALCEEFLEQMYKQITNAFDWPIYENTAELYFLLKSFYLMDKELTIEQIDKLIKVSPKSFELQFLKDLETSHLVVILKIYRMLNANKVLYEEQFQSIEREVAERISLDGIKQTREGLISSEATYYVLFFYYISNKLSELRDHTLLDNIISRIYRNLEILSFSKYTNYDLFSEILYSCKSLKLLNIVEDKEISLHLAKYLLPEEAFNRIDDMNEIRFGETKFRHLKINKITGEVDYIQPT